MSEAFNDPLTHLLELTSLPSGDPRRKDLDRELALMPEAERTRWTLMMHETDLLYGNLPQVDVPPDLQAKLLQIPQSPAAAQPAPPPPTPLAKIGPRPWRLYAACLLILLPVAGFAIWNMPRSETVLGPIVAPPAVVFDSTKANEVATLAEQLHESPPPLSIASSDPVAVQNALDASFKTYVSRFPAMVPLPKPPATATLLGGGVVSFGKTHAVFTRWTSGKDTLTLYQFDGQPFKIPDGFDKALVSTKSGHFVSIWPGYGNPCTWACVADNKPAAELFD